MRHTKFRVAITGAVTITVFSLIGSACTVSTTPGPASQPASPATPATAASSAGSGSEPPATATGKGGLPQPEHVVIVVEENESPRRLTAKNAPYIAALGRHGAKFTDAYAETHPSEPNYLALFSGSTHGLTSDSCPHTYSGANLGSEIIKSGRTFIGYAEGAPSDGYTGCSHRRFARKHTPWVNFSNVPASANLRFAHFPTSDFASLPTVSFVVPDLCHDMHNCSIAIGDAWLKKNLGAYASWAKTNNSLLIVVFDESELAAPNRIPLVMYGQPVLTGEYAQRVDHYSVLRTLEDMYGLPCTAKACGASPITNAFIAGTAGDASAPGGR